MSKEEELKTIAQNLKGLSDDFISLAGKFNAQVSVTNKATLRQDLVNVLLQINRPRMALNFWENAKEKLILTETSYCLRLELSNLIAPKFADPKMIESTWPFRENAKILP